MESKVHAFEEQLDNELRYVINIKNVNFLIGDAQFFPPTVAETSGFPETQLPRIYRKISVDKKKEHFEKPLETKGKLDTFSPSQDSILMSHAYNSMSRTY